MKRLLTSTTIVSMAMMPMAPLPMMAQVMDDTGRIIAADGTVLCEPTAELVCDLEDEEIQKAANKIQRDLDREAEAEAAAEAEAEAAAQAEAEAAAQAEAEAAAEAEAEAAAQAEAEAAAQAEAEAAAQAEAEAAAEAEAEAAAEAEAEAAAEAEAEAAAQAEAEAAAQAEADAAAQEEAEAAAQAEAEAAAQAEAEAAAEAEAEAEAAAQAEADAAAQAEADAAAQEEAEAAAQEEADAAAQAEAEAAAQEEVDAAAEEEADAAAQEVSDAAAQEEADAAAQAVADVAAQEEADAAAQAEADAAAQTGNEAAPEVLTDAEIQAQTEAALAEGAAETTSADGTPIDPAAGLLAEETPIDPEAPLIDAPVVSDTEAEALTTLLAAPAELNGEATPPEVAAPVDAPVPVIETDAGSDAPIDSADAEAALNAIPAPANTVATTVQTVTAAQTRSSAQEFKAAPKKNADGKKTGLSDLEKVGLFVLGAVVIGQVLNSIQGKSTVVSNTGDRVVVQNPDGTYGLYKDDDAILRQAGSTVRTETYNDGSSRTIVQRADGTQVVTVRDATGRVLRRAQYDRLGRELVLLDEFAPERPVNVADLPRPRVVGSTRSEDAALRAAIAARQIEKLDRGFSLRQIRDIAEVRALAAEVDVERVTFASGSAAITPEQANALADLGAVMQDMLVKNPAEMFLIEGHTDATGAAALNLALSDRRAESVALALSEYFAIPPENLIVQGYGETELRIDTEASEPQNRRVSVRLITPLLRPMP